MFNLDEIWYLWWKWHAKFKFWHLKKIRKLMFPWQPIFLQKIKMLHFGYNMFFRVKMMCRIEMFRFRGNMCTGGDLPIFNYHYVLKFHDNWKINIVKNHKFVHMIIFDNASSYFVIYTFHYDFSEIFGCLTSAICHDGNCSDRPYMT